MDSQELKELVGKYRRTFQGKDGEAVLADIRKRCFRDQTTFDNNHGRMGFNEGRRSVLVRIETMISIKPDEVADLPREYNPTKEK